MRRLASRVARFLSLRSRRFWLAALVTWFALLWWLSARALHLQSAPAIPHFDKFCHFVYFFAGGVALAALLRTLMPAPSRWPRVIALATLGLGLVGWLDEWHQSHTPGRSGNDPFDWAADLAGAACGAWCLRRIHSLSQASPESSQFA